MWKDLGLTVCQGLLSYCLQIVSQSLQPRSLQIDFPEPENVLGRKWLLDFKYLSCPVALQQTASLFGHFSLPLSVCI